MSSNKHKVIKTFNFSKPMMYAIQAITGHKTHEIMTFLTEEADRFIEACDLDINKRYTSGWQRDQIKNYIYYPGTKVYVGIYVATSPTYSGRWGSQEWDTVVNYSFKLPTTSISLNESQLSDVIAEAVLCDFSEDVEQKGLRSTKTTKQKEEEKEIKEAKKKNKTKAT